MALPGYMELQVLQVKPVNVNQLTCEITAVRTSGNCNPNSLSFSVHFLLSRALSPQNDDGDTYRGMAKCGIVRIGE